MRCHQQTQVAKINERDPSTEVSKAKGEEGGEKKGEGKEEEKGRRGKTEGAPYLIPRKQRSPSFSSLHFLSVNDHAGRRKEERETGWKKKKRKREITSICLLLSSLSLSLWVLLFPPTTTRTTPRKTGRRRRRDEEKKGAPLSQAAFIKGEVRCELGLQGRGGKK